jgi:ethanolamine transporter
LIRKYLEKPLSKAGETLGLGPIGTSGIVAAMANILAMFRLIKDMNPKEKVINISFAVCAAFLFGDHLAFSANFQPNLILIILLGKVVGGLTGICFAYFFVLKKSEELSFSPT